MHVTIRPLDVTSDLDIAQYSALDAALDEAAFGGSEVQTAAQCRASLTDSPYWRTQRWVAVTEPMEGGEMIVGRAGVFVPLQENLETIAVGASVHPAHRGRGIATALVEEALIPAIRESGRGLVEAIGEISADGDPDDPAEPVNRLATRLGVTRKNVAVCRTLALPLEEALLDDLQAEAEEKLGEYAIELWDDEVPEEHLAAYGLLMRQLELDEPDGDVEHEAPDYTPERIRTSERRRREAGTRALIAVAIAPDGSFVGNTEVHVRRTPGTTVGWQENTLVMPEHRGHRLGLALKVATHRLLREQAPGLRALVTWNSHVNPWMIAINEKLGYEITYRELVLQGRPQL
ncbi:GNAT family N-acetyltransferase [Brachybacterium sacelli]|uniref:GNAT superfamily N-acetyltransferase n=1 Tax=Brachybacterium sacelli TaxID=173364 RepID=A0ABS4WZR5_9MICO|nr:GNAT family N-acetyltransferase [Brachybacterium sacelli]MBP2381685.1 GNAT superfamily N-acetyltransferase [Brachybacterium sacelli]